MSATKKGRSITINEQILSDSETQAKVECRSLSSLVEFLLKSYLDKIKNQDND